MIKELWIRNFCNVNAYSSPSSSSSSSSFNSFLTLVSLGRRRRLATRVASFSSQSGHIQSSENDKVMFYAKYHLYLSFATYPTICIWRTSTFFVVFGARAADVIALVTEVAPNHWITIWLQQIALVLQTKLDAFKQNYSKCRIWWRNRPIKTGNCIVLRSNVSAFSCTPIIRTKMKRQTICRRSQRTHCLQVRQVQFLDLSTVPASLSE